MVVGKGWCSFFKQLDIQLPGYHLLKRLFSSLNWLGTIVKNQFLVYVRKYFCAIDLFVFLLYWLVESNSKSWNHVEKVLQRCSLDLGYCRSFALHRID